jgi:hypothetical protein
MSSRTGATPRLGEAGGSAPRQNADGHPCPPWCVTDHSKYHFHGSERITVEAPKYLQCSARSG